MKGAKYVWHLSKRTWSSYRARPLTRSEQDEVSRILLPSEQELWDRFPIEDQRHSFVVMNRLKERMETVDDEQLRAALLHDIGKIVSPLSTTMRVIATFVGPRTAAFRAYHDHEELGLQLLEHRSAEVTIRLLKDMYAMEHDSSSQTVSGDKVVLALIDADNI